MSERRVLTPAEQEEHAKVCCKTCWAWRPFRGDDDYQGSCRRRAPILRAGEDGFRMEDQSWPVTYGSDGCGEWDSRPPRILKTYQR